PPPRGRGSPELRLRPQTLIEPETCHGSAVALPARGMSRLFSLVEGPAMSKKSAPHSRSFIVAVSFAPVAVATLLACGSDAKSLFHGNGQSPGGDPGSGVVDDATTPVGTDSACVNSLQNAALPPV